MPKKVSRTSWPGVLHWLRTSICSDMDLKVLFYEILCDLDLLEQVRPIVVLASDAKAGEQVGTSSYWNKLLE